MNSQGLPSFYVNKYLPKLLDLHQDDYRIAILSDVLYSEDFRKNMESEETGKLFRVANIGDSVQYGLVPAIENMRKTIEMNIGSIAKLKDTNAMQPVTNVWIVVFETNTAGDDITTSVYLNPKASDCSDIIKGTLPVVACIFAIEYGFPKGQPAPEGIPDAGINWIMISPADANRMEDYEKAMLKQYTQTLEDVFTLDFSGTSAK